MIGLALAFDIFRLLFVGSVEDDRPDERCSTCVEVMKGEVKPKVPDFGEM